MSKSNATRERLFLAGLCVICGEKPYEPEHKLCQGCLENSKETSRIRRESLNKQGLCAQCGINPPKLGRMTCEACLNAIATNTKKQREDLKAAGTCASCGEQPARPNKVDCAACGIENSTRASAARATRKANGLCTYTGCKDLAVTGQTQCKVHKASEKKRKKQEKRDRIALGLCRFCSKSSIGANLCEYHYLKGKSHSNLGSRKYWEHLKDLFAKQNSKCFYCDINLQLAVNSEIDHKNSRSRFPEQAKDPNNVVWSCSPCNQAKWDLTAEEFIALCKRVAAKWPN